MNQKGEEAVQVILRSPGNQLEEVVLECPDLTWKRVFCELNQLTREGQVRLTMKGPGRYAVPNAISCNHPA